ncbi:efflux RND transporter periplasmic adaptor subunit [Hydrogenophaga pseudoflava]|uniref:efflux RND transporter periplasmic adaptor subunit n=1 Tax=Hydrogenophaga pseudoflava TaxID=47421 RepID=UPI0027E4F1FA|nr:efflux RND transporter periplasmic adaptor subunit [Hydrogenophaga pseudoflava]MDQ7745791.1 efflux RND transporter periplasmic adaptor subunit [Hydrogenophaga pseudoflava]
MNKSNNGAAKKRRWLIGGLAVAALAAILWASYRPRPLDVETATVAEGRFEQVIEEDGQLRLQQRYLVTAPTAAQLQRPTLKVGDAVKAGDVVAVLAPNAPGMIDARTRNVLQQRVGSADAAVAAARANVQRAQAALAQATLEAERSAQLAKDNFIAPSARDQSRLAREAAAQALKAAQAEQAAAGHAASEARAALGRAEPSGAVQGMWSLKSPVNGRVLKLHKDSSEPVQAGAPLLEIGDTGAMEAVIDVLSGDAPRIAAGAAVQLATGRNQPPLAGQVARVDPVAFTKTSALGIEEQRVNVTVALQAPPEELQKLGDGFRVDARITVSAQDSALLVPSAALVRQGEGWQVFVVEAGKARARAVSFSDRNADSAWVKDGLKAGETVILYPGSGMKEGQPVRVRVAR